MYISKLYSKEPFRCFNLDWTMDCKDINILVGDQGVGKSTLLSGLANKKEWLGYELTEKGLLGVDTFYFDTESMNPKMAEIHSYSTPDGRSKGIGMMGKLASHFLSHGENMKVYTADGIGKAKDCILFFDEPESGLSLRNQYRLANGIYACIKRNCQVFVATHSLVLIKTFPEVYSLEHTSWMSTDDFINSQK